METGHGPVRRGSTQSPQVVATTLSCELRFSVSGVHPEPSRHRLRRINGNGVVHRPLQGRVRRPISEHFARSNGLWPGEMTGSFSFTQFKPSSEVAVRIEAEVE